jgi:hypothetical protein
VIDPRYLTAQQWTDAVNLTLATAAPLPRMRGNDWQSWALGVLAVPSIAGLYPPDPRGFTDWRNWAERFVQCVPL